MWRVPQPTQEKLDQCGASYRVIHQASGMGVDGRPIPVMPGQQVKAEVIDLRTKTVIVEAYGPNEEAAVVKAVDLLPPNHSPARAADLAAENRELRKRLEKIEKKGPAIQSRVHAVKGGDA